MYKLLNDNTKPLLVAHLIAAAKFSQELVRNLQETGAADSIQHLARNSK